MNAISTALEGLARDLRLGARSLGRSPGFTAMAVLTLALGTGPNTAIFSLLDAVLLRPLPIAEPERLVALNNTAERPSFPLFSYPGYRDLSEQAALFEGLIAYRFAPLSVSHAGANERVWGYLVTGNYFDVLGVRPALGRLLTPNDDRERGAHPVVVIGHGYWKTRFGGSPEALGREVLVNGRSYTVVGVAPEGFEGTERVAATEMWLPMAMQAAVEVRRDWLDDRDVELLFVQGRLADGLSASEAQAGLDTLTRQLEAVHPESYAGRRVRVARAGMIGGFGRGLAGFTGSLLLFAFLVLLLACTNLANLLLARGSDRQGEIAVHLALGASRSRLVRRLLVESLLLAAAGSALGWLLATWLVRVATALRPPIPFFPLALEPRLDLRVLGFACLIGLATTLLFGLLPALQATRPNLVPALREGVALAGARRSWLRRGLVVSQVALSFVLLVGGGLMLRAAERAQAVPLGFQPKGAVEISMDLRLQGYDEGRGRELHKRLIESVSALPVVRAAGIADLIPIDLHFGSQRVYVEGDAPLRPDQAPRALSSRISPGYLRAIGTPLVRGRDFEERDDESAARVAIVNEAFARRHWPGQDPLGRRLRLGGQDAPPLLVVGVAGDSKYARLDEDARPFVYLPLLQAYTGSTTLVVRGDGDPQRLLAAARGALARLDPQIPLSSAQALEERMDVPLLPTRLAAAVLGSLGVLALLLAAVGIYGVTAYAVARRTREIGIRLALGATRAALVRLLVRDGAVNTLAGLALGSALALAVARLVERFLFGVSAADQATYLGVAALLAGVALVASYLPARRAAHADPVEALRYE